MEKLSSYKDLASRFNKHVSTIRRWFSNQRGIFRPNHTTVMVPESVVERFIKKNTYAKKRKS